MAVSRGFREVFRVSGRNNKKQWPLVVSEKSPNSEKLQALTKNVTLLWAVQPPALLCNCCCCSSPPSWANKRTSTQQSPSFKSFRDLFVSLLRRVRPVSRSNISGHSLMKSPAPLIPPPRVSSACAPVIVLFCNYALHDVIIALKACCFCSGGRELVAGVWEMFSSSYPFAIL